MATARFLESEFMERYAEFNPYPSESISLPPATLLSDPCWDEAGRVHDWRNHVPWYVRAVWDQMTDDVRIAIAAMAQAGADDEVWD